MKKWIKGLMACGLAFALTTTVYAEGTSPSGTNDTPTNVTVDGKDDGYTALFEEKTFTADVVGNESATKTINDLNNISETKTTIVAQVEAIMNDSTVTFKGAEKTNDGKIVVTPANDDKITIDMSKVKMLTAFDNLVVKDANDNEIPDAKNVRMTWKVVGLTEAVGQPFVLHYSKARNVFEVLVPESVDYGAGTITCVFPDLSPVAVIYVPKADVGTAISGKPAVDTHSNGVLEAVSNNSWMFMAGAVAVVVCAVGYGIFRKKTQE